MLRRRARHGHHPGADLSRPRIGGLRVELGPARLAEADEIAGLSRDLVERGLTWRWRRGSIVSHIRQEDSCLLAARDRGELVGFALMAFDWNEGDAHLLLLAVRPSHRRCGVATSLLAWLETVGRRGGIRSVHLEVREIAAAARALYTRLGFQQTGRVKGYYEGSEDALRLEKRLVLR